MVFGVFSLVGFLLSVLESPVTLLIKLYIKVNAVF